MEYIREAIVLLFVGLVLLTNTECRKIKLENSKSNEVHRIKKRFTNMLTKQYNDVKKKSNQMLLEELYQKRKEVPYSPEGPFERTPGMRPPGLWSGKDARRETGIPVGLWGGDSKEAGIPTGLWGGDANNGGRPGLWNGDAKSDDVRGLPGLWSGDENSRPGLWVGDSVGLPGLWSGDANSKSEESNGLPGLWSGDSTKGLPGLWSGDSHRQPGMWVGDSKGLPGLWSGDNLSEKSKMPGLWHGDSLGNTKQDIWGESDKVSRSIKSGPQKDRKNRLNRTGIWGKRETTSTSHANNNHKALEKILKRLIKRDLENLTRMEDRKTIK